jgi:hypothetical protein
MAFQKSIHRSAAPNEVQSYAILIRPSIHGPTTKFSSPIAEPYATVAVKVKRAC